MFYYMSIIAFMTLAPMNIPVQEKSMVGPFPKKFQCMAYKAQVSDMIDSVSNAQLIMGKCVERPES
jgi:hypothetical protein|tara:strand:+ start:221 stop:418 length:198 start_codon:yes stop_codon:yes gene_type:complete